MKMTDCRFFCHLFYYLANRNLKDKNLTEDVKIIKIIYGVMNREISFLDHTDTEK